MSSDFLFFSPLAPVWLLSIPAGLALLLAIWAWRRGAPSVAWHLLPVFLLFGALLNPRIATELSTPLPDIAAVVVDESDSMAVGERRAQAEAALLALQERLGGELGLDVRVARYKNPEGSDEGTRLFDALDRGMEEIPGRRLAGIVMVTDGEVSAIPRALGVDAPLHLLVAGSKAERDRKLTIDSAPAFGLVGQKAALAFRIDDPGRTGEAEVTIRQDGGDPLRMRIPVNQPKMVEIPLSHGGPNIVELEVEAAPGELTTLNNRLALSISGVRDRLRVLLISGAPHVGERMWRNILKSDPSVDLVHFTILRSMEKPDYTPLRELSLIPFPVQELFEEKLPDFDLVIFDRFDSSTALPPYYLEAVARYVEAGGAVLTAAGDQSAGDIGGGLAAILPTAQTGEIYEQPFLPLVSKDGRRHPVTASLPGDGKEGKPTWGRWMRMAGGAPRRGATTIMEADNGRPLLVLGESGKGRVAELLSDHVWMWGRGFEGGGPQAELLRRLAHWLMKEPELEAERLSAEVRNGRLEVERQSLSPNPEQVEATAPDGRTVKIALMDHGDGRASGALPVDQQGLWRVSDGEKTTLAASGSVNPVEMAALLATGDLLAPLVNASGGGVAWLEDGLPGMRMSRRGASGPGWFGFRANNDRMTQSMIDAPLLPAAGTAVLVLGALLFAWMRQGRRRP